MRTFAVLTTIALSLAAIPLVTADHEADGHDNDDQDGSLLPAPVDPAMEPTVAELLARIAELEAMVAALAGGASGEPGEAQQPCSPGVGCIKFPLYVDEIGDAMTGDLDMTENAKIKFLPQDQQQDVLTPASVIGPFGFDINAPANFSDLVKLHENATLNTTGGAKVFIDFDGNLTFADGSFLNPAQGFANQNWTFTKGVSILQNLTIHEGGNIVFENNTGFLQAGNFSRIGTTTDNEFIIIANNETAIVIHPGPTQGDAASIVAGHPGNGLTASAIGNFIAGGGSAAAPNFINGSWGIILGGSGNQILGDHGTVGGQNTAVLHDNSFAWGDGNGTFQTTAPKTFIVNATGGVGINTANPVSPLTVGGNITPDVDGVYSLGTPANRWHQLYMASEIDFVTELLYTSGGATVMSLDSGGNLSFAGALKGDASGLTGISSASLADGSITTGKLADGSITTDKLADGAVTAAKIGEVCPVGSVLKSDGSGWACGADLDTDTAYGAGRGLVLDGTVFAVDATLVQDRVATGCAAGSSIRSINQDGTVLCEPDDDTNTDTLAALTCAALQVAEYDDLSEAWVCGDDDDTTYGAGFGLNLQGTTFNVATADIQERVSSVCAEGSSIRAIAQDGAVTCETDTDTTYVANGPLTLAGGAFGVRSCSIGEILKFGEGGWGCNQDFDNPTPHWDSITDKPAGFADDQDDDTLAGIGCSTNQIVRWNGAAWVCAANTMPARPGPGTIVGPFDADRDVALIASTSPVLCYVDDNGNAAFDVAEPLYLHFGAASCDSRAGVSPNDLRLVAVGSHAAFTKVRAFDADAGNVMATYLTPSAFANLAFFDVDGNNVFNRGDALYADGDQSGTTTPGDYRWVGFQQAPGTVVRAGDSDVNVVLGNLTPLDGRVALWDLDGNVSRSFSDVYYLDLFQTGRVALNQSVRLGDLGAV